MKFEFCIDYDNTLFSYGSLTLSDLNMLLNFIPRLFNFFSAFDYEMRVFVMEDESCDE